MFRLSVETYLSKVSWFKSYSGRLQSHMHSLCYSSFLLLTLSFPFCAESWKVFKFPYSYFYPFWFEGNEFLLWTRQCSLCHLSSQSGAVLSDVLQCWVLHFISFLRIAVKEVVLWIYMPLHEGSMQLVGFTSRQGERPNSSSRISDLNMSASSLDTQQMQRIPQIMCVALEYNLFNMEDTRV